MQPRGREIPAMNVNSLLNLPEIRNHQNGESHFDPPSSHDDFFEQVLSSTSSFPWEFSVAESSQTDDQSPQPNMLSHFDDQSAMLASKLRHHQIGDSAAPAKALMLQQQLMLSGGLTGNGLRSPAGTESGLLPVPPSHNGHHDVVNGSLKSANSANEALYNGFIESLGQSSNQPPNFQHPQGEAILTQNFGAPAAGNQLAGSGGGTPPPPQPKQKVRARRGYATDPHSIAERLRREKIAERMKGLQELVPNANKTDKASMLDEIIDYVKFLQLQVKVLSMSRMGNAAGVVSRAADISSEGRSSKGNNDDGMKATEQQVAKLLEEDMGSALQYLQGKGLCLMPISLASAMSTSTSTCHSRNPMPGGPSSPSMSVLTSQSAIAGGNGGGEASVKEVATSVTSKP